MGNPLGVSAAGYHPVSEAHPRSSECSCRWPVEKTSDHRHGMVSTPQHSTPDVLHLIHPRNGPVCNSSQKQTGSVCVSSTTPSGSTSGCSVNSLGPMLGICLSSNCADENECFTSWCIQTSVECCWWLHFNITSRDFPMLRGLLVDFPQEVPPFPRLLRQPQSGVFHSHPEQGHLFAWNLSSVACESNSFLRQLPTLSARQLD